METREVNRWYVGSRYSRRAILFVKRFGSEGDRTDIGESYGFNLGNNWGTDFNCSIKSADELNFRLATPEEVETAMISYAKKQYPEGTSYKRVNSATLKSGSTAKIRNGFTWLPNKRILCNNGNVFVDGTWAELEHSDVEPKPKLTDFPYKVGDVIEVKRLTSWSSECGKCPLDTIKPGSEIKITSIGKTTSRGTILFSAIYNNEVYGFAYGGDNLYSPIKSPKGKMPEPKAPEDVSSCEAPLSNSEKGFKSREKLSVSLLKVKKI